MPQVLISIADPKLKSEVTGLIDAAALTQTVELQQADLAIYELGKVLPFKAKTPFVLVTDTSPSADNYKAAIRQGATDLLELPRESAGLLQKLSDLENKKHTKAKSIAIISGSGGAGATTIAAMAAWGLKRKFQTVLVDLNPQAGGIDVLFGQERNSASRWKDFENSQGEIPVKTFQNELISLEGLSLISHSREFSSTNSILNKKVLSSLLQAFDIAIIDTGIENIGETNFQEVIVVCTNTVRSVAACLWRIAEIKNHGYSPKLIVREVPGGDVSCEKISHNLNIELLAVVQTEIQLQKDIDRANFTNSRVKTFKTITNTFEKLLAI